jgi:hypothetical protein
MYRLALEDLNNHKTHSSTNKNKPINCTEHRVQQIIEINKEICKFKTMIGTTGVAQAVKSQHLFKLKFIKKHDKNI